MARSKRRGKSTTQRSGALPATTPTSKQTAAKSSLPSKLRRWVANLALLILSPVIVFGGLEAGLRLFGYGYSTQFLIPVPGTNAFTINEKFPRRFYPNSDSVKSHPFLLPAQKASNAFRIFVVGESAALGTPNPAFGFSRILEVILRDQFPNRRIEIYNAAMRGINSHIIAPIVEECARQQPDLFLVYMGNNEVCGLHGPGPNSTFLDRHLSLIHLTDAVKGTRIAQWLMSIIGSTAPPKQDMAFSRAYRFAPGHPHRQPVSAHFRSNLDRMCRTMTGAGAKVILSTVGANLEDCPPLGSLLREGLSEAARSEWQSAFEKGILAEKEFRFADALGYFQKALSIDEQPADLHFRLARCLVSLQQFERAREEYRSALNQDALQVRTESRLNDIIRATAREYAGRGATLSDAERALAESEWSEHGIPGRELFLDHVHPRFAGDYLLARTFHAAIVAACSGQLGPRATNSIPTLEQCAEQLAYNTWENLEIEAAATQQMAIAPFLDQIDHASRIAKAQQEIQRRSSEFTAEMLQKVEASYARAIARHPDDWQLHFNFGNYWLARKQAANAIPHLEMPVHVFPNQLALRLALSSALAQAGRHDEALRHLREALRIDPKSKVAQEGFNALSRSNLRP